jgi:hypothetical protein
MARRLEDRGTAASSTTWPAYITITRSATSATTPRSWVMSDERHAALALQASGAARASAPGP